MWACRNGLARSVVGGSGESYRGGQVRPALVSRKRWRAYCGLETWPVYVGVPSDPVRPSKDYLCRFLYNKEGCLLLILIERPGSLNPRVIGEPLEADKPELPKGL